MKTIDSTGFAIYKISDFVSNVYKTSPKKMLFWDTCALFEIIRFMYRQSDRRTFEAIQNLHDGIVSGDILSIASKLTITEWNDNITDVWKDITDSLDKTSLYHFLGVEAIKGLINPSAISVPLNNISLEDKLEEKAFDIIEKTHFIDTEEIANEALMRLAYHMAPGGKKSKSESKDCAVWQTMLDLNRNINTIGMPSKPMAVFLTVNTDDFADKSRGLPYTFQSLLLTESTAENFMCALTFSDAYSLLH